MVTDPERMLRFMRVWSRVIEMVRGLISSEAMEMVRSAATAMSASRSNMASGCISCRSVRSLSAFSGIS